MANPSLLSSLFFFLILFACSTPTLSKKSTYIVHVLHSHKPIMLSAHDWYFSILHSTLTSPSNTSTNSMPDLMYTYSHSTTGFAAQITATQAARLRRLPFVLSVDPDQVEELTTTHSPDFIGLSKRSDSLWPNTDYGSGTIIGVVDSGIWPESDSFHDVGINNVPAKWKGSCESGPDFPASSCNKKLIGARSFFKGYEALYGTLSKQSARDETGHGTHCASIAAGSAVKDANYRGYALGEARGVALRAHIAAYKVFWGQTSRASSADILAAIDAAIDDGVDVISLSLSPTINPSNYYQDQKAVASFRAMQKGIVVSASAGNQGPSSFTVNNVSPWMLTVAASSVDRQFLARVLLGNGRVITGSTLYDFKNFPTGETAPAFLITGRSAGSSVCIAGKLDSWSVTNKVVICEEGSTSPSAKSIAVQQAGGLGIILVTKANSGEQLEAFPYVIPGISVTHNDGEHIESHVSSSPVATASFQFRGTVIGPSPSASRLAAFSSRGPNKITPQILKPDVTAPGLNILAAWIGPC